MNAITLEIEKKSCSIPQFTLGFQRGKDVKAYLILVTNHMAMYRMENKKIESRYY